MLNILINISCAILVMEVLPLCHGDTIKESSQIRGNSTCRSLIETYAFRPPAQFGGGPRSVQNEQVVLCALNVNLSTVTQSTA
jgi:hypothetical protein